MCPRHFPCCKTRRYSLRIYTHQNSLTSKQAFSRLNVAISQTVPWTLRSGISAVYHGIKLFYSIRISPSMPPSCFMKLRQPFSSLHFTLIPRRAHLHLKADASIGRVFSNPTDFLTIFLLIHRPNFCFEPVQDPPQITVGFLGPISSCSVRDTLTNSYESSRHSSLRSSTMDSMISWETLNSTGESTSYTPLSLAMGRLSISLHSTISYSGNTHISCPAQFCSCFIFPFRNLNISTWSSTISSMKLSDHFIPISSRMKTRWILQASISPFILYLSKRPNLKFKTFLIIMQTSMPTPLLFYSLKFSLSCFLGSPICFIISFYVIVPCPCLLVLCLPIILPTSYLSFYNFFPMPTLPTPDLYYLLLTKIVSCICKSALGPCKAHFQFGKRQSHTKFPKGLRSKLIEFPAKGRELKIDQLDLAVIELDLTKFTSVGSPRAAQFPLRTKEPLNLNCATGITSLRQYNYLTAPGEIKARPPKSIIDLSKSIRDSESLIETIMTESVHETTTLTRSETYENAFPYQNMTVPSPQPHITPELEINSKGPTDLDSEASLSESLDDGDLVMQFSPDNASEDKLVLSVFTMYKRVDKKVKPVSTSFPEECYVRRHVPVDPLLSLPLLPFHPPDFVPTKKITEERLKILNINEKGFLSPDEEIQTYYDIE